MVVTYAVKGTEDASLAGKLLPNGAYQLAKILSYMIVGLALGTLGSVLNLEAIRPYVMVLAGAFMIVLALGMTGRFPWAARLTPRPPKFLLVALSRVRRKASADAAEGHNSLSTPIFFGLLTGLMPCAPLIAAQLQAAASGSPLTGALGMMAFGIGTAPLMLGFGTASSMLPKRLKERAMVVLAVVVLLFGFTYLNRGAMLLGSPITGQTIKQYVLEGPAEEFSGEFTEAADGVVEIPLTIANVRFEPSSLVIPADRPVRLIVDRQESNACSDQLMIPQMNILVDLEPFATTVVELPPAAAGNYTLTCGMGMMAGRIVVGEPGQAVGGGGASPLLFGLFGVAAVALGLALYRRKSPASAGAKRGGAGSRTAPSSSGLFGFTPEQTLIILGVLAAAILAGVLLGTAGNG
jgi:sulfite exporter TauE/SafE